MTLVLDTNVLFAALNRTQPSHIVCRRLIETSSEELAIPAPVLPEVDYFVGRRLYADIFIGLLRDIELGNFRVVQSPARRLLSSRGNPHAVR